MARPVPGRRGTCEGNPRRLSETNGMHDASGYLVRTDAEHATPLTWTTYRARTRYRLAGPRLAGEKLPAGTWDWPAVPRWNPLPSGRGGCQVTVPENLLETFTIGPVEFARPTVTSTYGGGISTNNYLWRKVNAETVTKTVVGASL